MNNLYNKIIFLSLFFYVLYNNAIAQSCEIKTFYKGDILIIEKSCKTKKYTTLYEDTSSIFFNKMNKYEYHDSKIYLNNSARIILLSSLKKALLWAEINKNKNLSFSKRIIEISAKAWESSEYGHDFNTIEIIFQAKDSDNYEVIIYGIYIDLDKFNQYKLMDNQIFDIENPGEYITSLNSKNEIDYFIKLITDKHLNINEIFK